MPAKTRKRTTKQVMPAKGKVAKAKPAKAKSRTAKPPGAKSAKHAPAAPAKTARTMTAAERYALETRDPAALVPLYEALCAWVGRGSVDAAVAQIDTGLTPFLYMCNMASKLPQLVDKLAPAADRNVLAFLLDPKNRRDVVHVNEEDEYPGTGTVMIDPERFAKEGAEILDTGRLLTMRGKAVIVLAGINDGNLWEIDARNATDHGSVATLVAQLQDQLH